MKSLNGLLFIVAGGIIIWIGATGRLPALAAALGMIRNAPGSGAKKPQENWQGSAGSSAAPPPNFNDVTSGTTTTAPGALSQPFLTPWKDVLGLQ